MTELLGKITQIGADPNDENDVRLRKSLLVLLAFLFMLAGIAWGLMYFWFGETTAGMIPFLYGIFSLLSVIYFGLTGR